MRPRWSRISQPIGSPSRQPPPLPPTRPTERPQPLAYVNASRPPPQDTTNAFSNMNPNQQRYPQAPANSNYMPDPNAMAQTNPMPPGYPPMPQPTQLSSLVINQSS